LHLRLCTWKREPGLAWNTTLRRLFILAAAATRLSRFDLHVARREQQPCSPDAAEARTIALRALARNDALGTTVIAVPRSAIAPIASPFHRRT
jgi:hypothetical protein